MRVKRRGFVLLPLVAAACATGGPPEPEFPPPPLDFGYLVPLRLNVAEVRIEQRYQPSGQPPEVGQFAPVPPVAALRRMAEQRVFAGGTQGVATFIIQDASIRARRVPGQSMFSGDGERYDGSMMVRLEVRGGEPEASGYATAQVRRSVSLPEKPSAAERRRVLDTMVRQMMADMNVEFEYQVRQNLKDWLQSPEAAPAPPPVQQEDLTTPGSQSDGHRYLRQPAYPA